MRISKAQQIRILEAEIENLKKSQAAQATALNEDVAVEQAKRVAAQRGLTPYVTAVQALNAWLSDRPPLLVELTPILKELGLFGVRVGYDPDRDLALSVIGAHRL